MASNHDDDQRISAGYRRTLNRSERTSSKRKMARMNNRVAGASVSEILDDEDWDAWADEPSY